MLSFDFKNSGVKTNQLAGPAKKLLSRVNELKYVAAGGELNIPEGFVNLPGDKAGIRAVKDMASRKASNKLAAVAVIGIGGSTLGARAIATALGTKRPIVFIDNVDPDSVKLHLRHLDYAYSTGRHVLIVAVSKSGTTMETLANFKAVLNWLKAKDKKWRERVVAVTNPGSPLHKICEREKFDVLFSEPEISGRFSFLGPVGLFPLAVAGVDIDALIRGASAMGKKCLSGSISENPAARGAITLFASHKKICNNFVFSDKLERLAIFAGDLLAESVGKDGKGITPMVSIGSTDLHSMGQLYFGGPKDKFTVFIGADPAVNKVFGEDLGRVIKTIGLAVRKSYTVSRLPYYSVDFGRVSPQAVGEFMAMKMFETVYLGHLMGVNVFGQPAVELYKKTARRLLGN